MKRLKNKFPLIIETGETLYASTLYDVINNKQKAKFVETVIDQIHSNTEIASILGLNNETSDQTKTRILKDTRFPFKNRM